MARSDERRGELIDELNEKTAIIKQVLPLSDPTWSELTLREGT